MAGRVTVFESSAAIRSHAAGRLVVVVVLAAVFGRPVSSYAATCASLSSVAPPDTTISLAQEVAAGAFTPPAAGQAPANPPQYKDLPAFCRVQATSRATSDAPIKIEVWLPAAGWNGRLRGVGNDGFYNAAPIATAALAGALRAGYASVGSDGGRQGDASYILRQSEQLTNFNYRATHEMTVAAKALVTAFYGRGPTLSGVAECGGRSATGLSSMQRYPADYDAVAVGEFIGDSTRHMANQWWVWLAHHQSEASAVPTEKYALIHQAALDLCDAQHDHIKDGIIGDPTRCAFDPVVLQCKGGDAPNCLTAPQVETVRKVYAGATNPRTKARVAPPLLRGSELTWGPLIGPLPNPVSLAFFKYFVLRDADWDYKTRPVNFDGDIALADKQTAALPINLTNADLRTFVGSGGKLLIYAGWNDPFVPPGISVDYYNSVVARIGEKAARDSVRLFMVPGMRNCPGTGGPDAFNFDPMAVVQQWKESGKAPEEIVAPHFQNGTEVGKRLICAYPKLAVYKGSGDPHDAASFACRAY
jgi:Tannase and feruloyl esterase